MQREHVPSCWQPARELSGRKSRAVAGGASADEQRIRTAGLKQLEGVLCLPTGKDTSKLHPWLEEERWLGPPVATCWFVHHDAADHMLLWRPGVDDYDLLLAIFNLGQQLLRPDLLGVGQLVILGAQVLVCGSDFLRWSLFIDALAQYTCDAQQDCACGKKHCAADHRANNMSRSAPTAFLFDWWQ